jgi:hypothetical protein
VNNWTVDLWKQLLAMRAPNSTGNQKLLFDPLKYISSQAAVPEQWVRLTVVLHFLSILSIKCRNWFYWADRAERADRAESKESPVFMLI